MNFTFVWFVQAGFLNSVFCSPHSHLPSCNVFITGCFFGGKHPLQTIVVVVFPLHKPSSAKRSSNEPLSNSNTNLDKPHKGQCALCFIGGVVKQYTLILTVKTGWFSKCTPGLELQRLID